MKKLTVLLAVVITVIYGGYVCSDYIHSVVAHESEEVPCRFDSLYSVLENPTVEGCETGRCMRFKDIGDNMLDAASIYTVFNDEVISSSLSRIESKNGDVIILDLDKGEGYYYCFHEH